MRAFSMTWWPGPFDPPTFGPGYYLCHLISKLLRHGRIGWLYLYIPLSFTGLGISCLDCNPIPCVWVSDGSKPTVICSMPICIWPVVPPTFPGNGSNFFREQGMAETWRANKETMLHRKSEPIAAAKYSSTVLVCSLASRFGINQHVALIKFEGGTRKRTWILLFLWLGSFFNLQFIFDFQH